MKKAIFAVFLTLLFASPALAQDRSGADKRVFFFGAPGVLTGTDTTTVHFGGGTEVVWSNGLGFAFDAGYLAEPAYFSSGAMSFSPAMLYQFPIDGPVKPYVRGGGTMIVGTFGGDLLWTIGGGINYFFKDNMALKVEVRDSFHSYDPGGGLVDVLIGLSFRY